MDGVQGNKKLSLDKIQTKVLFLSELRKKVCR